MEEKDFNELVARIEKASAEKISTQVKEALKTIDTDKINSLLGKELTTKEELETVKQLVVEATEKANQAIEGNKQGNANKSFEEQLREKLHSLKSQLAAVKGNKNVDVKFEIKAAATQTTANITLPAATPASYTYQMNPQVIAAPEMIPFVQNFTDNGSTELVALPWVDEVSMDGDAAFIGEGVIKPLIDIDYQIRYSQAKKVAGKIKVSEEALTDIPFMEAEINRKLRQRHDLALQDGILNGDGNGANLKGITEYAAAFAAGGLAAAVEAPQNYDVIVAAFNQILVTSDSNYIPNAIFVHPTDAALMKLTKDADENYIMPPFAMTNGDMVNGVRVVQNTKIPVGYFLIGDFSKSHVRTYVGFSIRIGYGTDTDNNGASDFEKNLVTVLGESRVHHYISQNEAIAFVYDQFSVAKTALELVEA
jgi:HK97 family phage major capsid protein